MRDCIVNNPYPSFFLMAVDIIGCPVPEPIPGQQVECRKGMSDHVSYNDVVVIIVTS